MDIFVSGWAVPEVKREVMQWMMAEGIQVVEQYDSFLKGKLGKESIWTTPPKYFAVSFFQQQTGVVVHMEGWFLLGASQMDFSKDAILHGVPRREGWTIMERLWNRLRMLPNRPASAGAVSARVIKRICPQCGRVLTDEVKFCPYCGRKLG
jgi:hypothetical protein